jgi:hypothetical protein
MDRPGRFATCPAGRFTSEGIEMTTHFKITKSLLEQIRSDLCRPHPFAFERVGFLFIRPGTASLLCNPGAPQNRSGHEDNPPMKSTPKWYSRFLQWLNPPQTGTLGENCSIAETRMQSEETLMILAVSYFPACDEDYINDPKVGAKIGSAAIRDAMQRSLDTGMGVIHVHMHEGTGCPGFSLTDGESMNNLMPSFFNVSPGVPHGALVFNRDNVAGVIWKDKKTSLAISRVSVIGYPCEFSGRSNRVRTLQ